MDTSLRESKRGIGKKFQKIDEFSTNFTLKLDSGQKSQPSYFGAVMSILLGMMTLMFTATKVLTIVQKSDVDIMSALIENNIDYTEKFDTSQGLFIAAAITEYDSNTEIIEEERYGELIVEHYGWGYDPEAAIGSGSNAIDYHYCSDEELGIDRSPETLIYPIFEQSKNEVMTFKKKFKCIPKEDLVAWGDYNSASAQQIAFKFKMCVNKTICESEENIREWLKGKYILLLYN